MVQAIVAVLPDPVTPRSTTPLAPFAKASAMSRMARGWSPAGWKVADMRKEAVKVTPGDIIAPGQGRSPELAPEAIEAQAPAEAGPAASKPRAKPKPRTGAAKASRTGTATLAAPPAAAAVSAAAAAAPEAAQATASKGGAEEAPAAEAADPGAARRNFFRLDVFDVQVRFELESIGGETPDPTTIAGILADVSAGGLRLAAGTDAGPMPNWPVSAEVFGHIQFSLLEDEPAFVLPGRLVRRVETTSGFELAFSWQDPPQPEVDRLVHDLYQLELRRRASIPDDKRSKHPKPGAAHAGASHRQPVLIGAALGLAAAVAVYETMAMAAVAPVLGVAAVILAAAYLIVGA